MKRFLKIAGLLIGFLLVIFLALAGYVQFSSFPVFENKAPEFSVTPDSLKIAEGERIVRTLCANCHLSDDKKLGGKHMPDAGAFGEIYSTNITNHPTLGALPKYSDGELAYLIRTGIKRDGNYAPPWMIKLPHLSNADMEAVISFLRSDHPMLQPSEKPNQPSNLNFIAKALVKFGIFAPLEYPINPITAPSPTNKVAFGKYLAVAKFDCFACHSADFATCDYAVPENSVGFFGGGNPMPDLEGNIIYSANLTSHKETGLGNWTEEQFIRSVKTGIRPEKIASRYPMFPYTLMTDEEASAIWAYLQTLPPINNPNDFTPASE